MDRTRCDGACRCSPACRGGVKGRFPLASRPALRRNASVRLRSNSNRLLGRRDIPRSVSGVGLVELMVVVTIISMLMLAGVPTYNRIQRKARASAITNDFRVFAAVFQAHAHETGSWPAETAVGIASSATSTVILDVDLMREIDRALDDGDLTTGSFRLGGDGGPLFILEP